MTKAEVLTSSRNPLLREVRRAVFRGTLTDDGYCVAESFHLLEEAIRSRRQIKAILVATPVRSAVEGHVRGLSGLRVHEVDESTFAALASTENSQGVIALVRPPTWTLEQLFRGKSLVVVLDGVQDPGNAGATVRAAEAFGATGVLFLKGTVNPFNPKTLRASAGSLFRLPVVSGVDGELARVALRQKRVDIHAAMPNGKTPLTEADLRKPVALIVGGEGRGVSGALRAGATELRIPTTGVESLNAAMAAGIILYEARRQRMLPK